jgi:LDH2 family malate/lactate/ureidoglycolate dehydrogenase
MLEYQIFRAEDLKDYVVRFFTRLDVPREHAETAAEILVAADLRGVESHGIIRLNSYYGSRIRKGQVDPRSPYSIVSETPTTLLMDGGNGLGMAVSTEAMRRCIEKARQNSIAMVTVRNSNHYGIAGYYAMMALEHNMIGISFTNAQPLVAPTYGRTAILGTNPIAVAVPAGTQRPYVLDMATSIVPVGRITVYDKAGKPIPEGWGLDQEGRVTNTPSAVLKGGALMPLGGTDIMRGYKGYGLALLVDILSGVLSGAAVGQDVGRSPDPKAGANVGHFFCVINIEAFRPLVDFQAQMDYLIGMMKNAPKAAGEERIYIHGEKEFEMAERYQRDGVPVMTEVVKMLAQAGEEIGVPWDLQPLGIRAEAEEEL